MAAVEASAARFVRRNPQGPRARGLLRERLLSVLPEIWRGRFGLLVAPAGSGKTTLLSQFATAAECAAAIVSVSVSLRCCRTPVPRW
jgi:ATP/maltotriose-dependent transcriptional regulator MalT